MDCKKCDRPAKVKGFCKPHYSARRKKWERAGIWKAPITAVGTTRRLRALVALGHSQHDLCRRSGLPPSTVSHLVRGTVKRTSRDTAKVIVELYDQLSMTPGTCEQSKARAKANRWAPPLAWDDGDLDDPNGQPDIGQRRTVSWVERYLELRDTLGLTQEQIAQRLGINRESLLRQMDRHGIA